MGLVGVCVFWGTPVMERSFSQFGHGRRFRIDSALGLDDQQIQIDELEDIESFMPDVTLEMFEPSPGGTVIGLRLIGRAFIFGKFRTQI